MSKMLALMAGSVVALGLLLILLARNGTSIPSQSNEGTDSPPLMIYCAASNRAVIEEIRLAYEAETGQAVQAQYGPSQTLLSTLEVSRSGDLFLPADDSYLKTARDKRMVDQVLPIATMQAVVVVVKGNPKKVARFEDLLRDDVRLVQASPDSAAIGKLTRQVLQGFELWSQLEASTDGYRSTVTDVANDLVVGAADAGIVYDAVLTTYPQLTAIELPQFAGATSQVSVGRLTFSQQPSAALRFARYLSAADRGLEHYRKFGFRVVHGESWEQLTSEPKDLNP